MLNKLIVVGVIANVLVGGYLVFFRNNLFGLICLTIAGIYCLIEGLDGLFHRDRKS